MRLSVLRMLGCGFKRVGLFSIFVAMTNVHGQVVLPISPLQYDAPSLPPSLWPATNIVTRDLALLPVKTLEDKNSEQYQLPYHFNFAGAYRDAQGNFGRLTLANSTAADISFDGDIYSGSFDFSTQRDTLLLGAMVSYEDLDLSSFSQQRAGIMPYGRWMIPLSQRTSFNVLGTLYYFHNSVDSRMAPRVFADYSTLGASLSAALHFDTRYAYKAVTVAQDSPGGWSYIGSVAVTLHVQNDDAEREVVFQQNVVDEVSKQQLLVLAGNVGVRLQERTAIVLMGEYGSDRSHYDGSLNDTDDDYLRISFKFTRTLSADWSVQGGVGRVLGHDVEVTDLHVSVSTTM